MKNSLYLILLADRKRARMFKLFNGLVYKKEEFTDGHVPQKVKHGSNTWDAQNKIFRHIEDHLHRHLTVIGKRLLDFAKGDHVTGIVIGSHKPLFAKIQKHIPYPLSKKVKGTFVTELKGPFNEILRRAKKRIEQIENEKGTRE